DALGGRDGVGASRPVAAAPHGAARAARAGQGQIRPLTARSTPTTLELGHPAAGGVDLAVLAALDQAAQAVERVPDVGIARVERRDPEPDRVRAAEVRDDVRAL